MANRIAYSTTKPTVGHGFYRVEKVYGGAIPLVTGDLVAGNTVALFRVPKGFTIVGVAVDIPVLDTNGSKTLTFSLGDAASAARIVSASNAGQAGATTLVIAAGARGYTYTAETDIVLTVVASAATAAAGTLVLFLDGYIDA